MANMKQPICVHCGKTEDEHCLGFERKMPDGCQCSPGEWGDRVKPICAEYVANGIGFCRTCEHDMECHK